MASEPHYLSHETRPASILWPEHPTPAGVDGERSEPLHPCPRWAEKLCFGDVLPVAGQPTHTERTTNTRPMKPNAKPNRMVWPNAKLNLACRDVLPVAKTLPRKPKTLTVKLALVSTGTRRTSKKPNLCGLQPVARKAPTRSRHQQTF